MSLHADGTFNVLLIEDDDADADLMLVEAASAGLLLNVTRASNAAEARAALADLQGVDAVLCDYFVPELNALGALELIKRAAVDVPLIVVSGRLSNERATECMRLGAADYIQKDRLSRLPHALTQVIEHARADRAGREVERSYQRLFENLPMAVFRATAEGQILHANSAAVKMFGFADLESMLGATAFDLHADPGDGHALMARLQTTGDALDFESQMRRADGSEFWFNCTVHGVREEDGRVAEWETIGRDVSERRVAELALAKSDERLRSVLAGAPVAVATLDREGRFTFAGGSVFSQFGLDPGSLVGHLVAERFARPDVVELLTTALEHDVQADLAFGGRTFHVRSGPFRPTPDGDVIGVLGVAFDHTERVEAEQRLSRRVAQETILRELSRAGLDGGATADFLARAVELVARGTETPFATILEVRPADDCLIRVAAHGHSVGVMPMSNPVDASVPGASALHSDVPVVIPDYQARDAPTRAPWMVEAGVAASMAMRILGPMSPYGVFSVYSDVPRDFTPDNLEFMQLASAIISVAIERKRGEDLRRMLLGRLVTAQEAERRTIAEDIHDDAVQIMTAANLRLELFRMVLTDPVQLEAADALQETISLAIGRLRNLLFNLIPPNLDRHGLAAGFTLHLEQFEADTGVRWELHSELDEEPAAQVRVLLFRIFQEALVNVRKHARATTVTVSMRSLEGGVLMGVRDDGVGFWQSAVEPLGGHLGLASMRERAEIAGGWGRLTTEPGHGTEVLTWVPAPRDDEPASAPVAEGMSIA